MPHQEADEMLKALHGKLALALVVGVGSVGLFGAAALGAFGSETSTLGSAIAPATSTMLGEDKPEKLKAILDALVQKGVITQQQEDAILAAVNEKPTAARAVKVLRDLFAESATYLGVSAKDLHTKVAGTTLGKVADGTPNKSRAGLLVALTTAANDDINKALSEKRITDDQAKKLRDGLATEITKFVDRAWPAPKTTKPRTVVPNVKSFVGDLLTTGRDYLGIPLADLTTQLRTGKSIGEIADATPGKSRAGLIAALTLTANAKIDKAAADKQLTAEQVTSLKTKVAAEITSFVDRKSTVKNVNAAGTVKKP